MTACTLWNAISLTTLTILYNTCCTISFTFADTVGYKHRFGNNYSHHEFKLDMTKKESMNQQMEELNGNYQKDMDSAIEVSDKVNERQNTIRSLCSSLSLTKKEAVAFLSVTAIEDGDVLEKVKYFRVEVGLSKDKLRSMILQHPKLVATCLLDDVKTTIDFLQEDLQLSPRQLSSLTATSPSVINYYRTDLKRNLAFLRGSSLCLTEENLKKVVMKRPQLLGYSLNNLYKTTTFFREYLGLFGEELGILVTRFPFILAYSVENNLKPTISYFGEDVFIHCETSQKKTYMASIIKRFPQVLGFSIENINKKISYLRKRLDLSNEELARIIYKFPQILSLSIESNLEEKFCFFTNMLGLTESELRLFILTTPTTLSLSLKNNLNPKFKYLYDEVKLSKRDLRIFLQKTPGLLSYSLEGRIKPRFHTLDSNGLKLKDVPIYTVGLSEKRFKKWLKNATEKGD